MNGAADNPEASGNFSARARVALTQSQAFRQLAPETQGAILRDLGTIDAGLRPQRATKDPYALSLESMASLQQRLKASAGGDQPAPQPAQPPAGAAPRGSDGSTPDPKSAATETLARRAGALSDEVNFPAFVAGLLHGTWDAIVKATIQQMEAFANLVSAVAKDVETFTAENVTPNQARDWLVERYPRDLMLELPAGPDGGSPRVRVRRAGSADDEPPPPPSWLSDFGLQGQDLTDEMVEGQLVPAAQRRVGEDRLQLLATMVLLGMNRVNVKDGTISARLRFRAAANDKASVDYAVNQDPGGADGSWGSRGSAAYDQHTTMVSTVGVNVQAETDLKVELFGEVKINFVSETLPLDRFVDSARMTLLQRNARNRTQEPPPAAAPQTAAPAPAPAAAAPPAPVPPAAPAAPPAPAAQPPAAAAPGR